MISYYFMMSLYTSILRIYETSNNMCILFDTAVKEKGRIRVVFSNFTRNMLQFVPKKQSTCHVFLHLNSTQASPEGDAFAAICTQRRRAVQAMSFPVKHRATQSKFSVMVCFPFFSIQVKMNARSPNERSFFFTEHYCSQFSVDSAPH